MDKKEETNMEERIDFIAKTTLGALKGVFAENNLSDREATLSLMYFIEVCIKLGWKDMSPIIVLQNIIQVIRSKEEW